VKEERKDGPEIKEIKLQTSGRLHKQSVTRKDDILWTVGLTKVM
jgi:hypothetical protein